MAGFSVVKMDVNSVRVRHESGHEFTFNYAFDDEQRRVLSVGMAHLNQAADIDFRGLEAGAYHFAALEALRAGEIDR